MKKLMVILAGLVLVGCNGTLTVSQQQALQADKDNYCPVLNSVTTALKLNNVKLNGVQQSTVDTLTAACADNSKVTVAALAGYATDVAIVLAQVSQKK